MGNSLQNDYFSFMSDRRKDSAPKRHAPPVAPRAKPVMSADTIDFVEETSQMEVIESIASDTMIQRVRTHWSSAG